MSEYSKIAAGKCIHLPAGQMIDVSTKRFVITHFGQNVNFSDTDINWVLKVKPENYTTLVNVTDSIYFTLLVNRSTTPIKIHFISHDQAMLIENCTGQSVRRSMLASTMQNRVLVKEGLSSSSSSIFKTMIPECLYKHNQQQQSSSSSSSSCNQPVSDLFSQNSYLVMESIANDILHTWSDERKYEELTKLDEIFKSFVNSSSSSSSLSSIENMAVAKAAAKLKFGESNIEMMSLFFILSQSKMRARLNISKLKIVRDDKASAIAARERFVNEARRRAAEPVEITIENDDDNELPKPTSKVVANDDNDDDDDDVTIEKHTTTTTTATTTSTVKQDIVKKRRRSQQKMTHDEQASFVLKYKATAKIGRKMLLIENNVCNYDVNNWQKRIKLQKQKKT